MKIKGYQAKFTEMLLEIASVTQYEDFVEWCSTNAKYNDIDKYVIFEIFRCVHRRDNYETYDEILKKYPDANDTNLFTLYKAVIKQAYGNLPHDLV